MDEPETPELGLIKMPNLSKRIVPSQLTGNSPLVPLPKAGFKSIKTNQVVPIERDKPMQQIKNMASPIGTRG